MKPGERANAYQLLDELRADVRDKQTKVSVAKENIVDTLRDIIDESKKIGSDLLPGKVVSPEIEVAKASLLNTIGTRTPKSIDWPEGVDVEKTLIDNGGVFKLGTGPHHVSKVSRILSPDGTTYGPYTNKAPKPAIPEAVLVHIQNVRNYYVEHSTEHGWDKIESIASFFCVRLPFPSIVFSYDHEFQHPETKELVTRHMNVTVTARDGAYFSHYLTDEDLGPQLGISNTAHLRGLVDAVKPDCYLETRIAVDALPLPGRWFVFIDKTGQVLSYKDLGWLYVCDPSEEQWFQDAFCKHGSIALTAIQFMNCKNVEILDNPPTRQQRRSAERDGKEPPVTYKTLMIHPFGQKRRVVTQANGAAIPGVSLHVVRGHFKSYMQGPGLGRYHAKGIYWWSANIRGTAERGKVVKDYEVKAEE